MSEPLSRGKSDFAKAVEAEGRLIASLRADVAELERDRDRWLELCGRELKRADTAEAGLTAAQEALRRIASGDVPVGDGLAMARVAQAALARGGGQQETGPL